MFDDATALQEWNSLLQRHRKRLEHIAYRIAGVMGVADEADEIIQDALEALLGKWNKVRSTTSPATGACEHHGPMCEGIAEVRVHGTFIVRGKWRERRRLLCTACRVETDDDRQCAYFTRIVTRRAADYAKKKRRRAATSIDDPNAPEPVPNGSDADVQAAAEDRVAAEELGAALRKLPAWARDILILRYALDYSVAETAQKLDLTKSVVTTRSGRAVAKARALLPAWIRDRYWRPDEPPEPEGGANP